MGKGFVEPTRPTTSPSLRAAHNLLSCWERYQKDARRNTHEATVLTLNGLEVDHFPTCTSYLRQEVKKLPEEQQQIHRICLRFVPTDITADDAERTSENAGTRNLLSRWLEESGVAGTLRSIRISDHAFTPSMQYLDAVQSTLSSTLNVLASHSKQIEEFYLEGFKRCNLPDQERITQKLEQSLVTMAPTLTSFSCKGSTLTTQLVLALANGLSTHLSALQSLNMRECKIDSHMWQEFVSQLGNMEQLKNVFLCDNNLDIDSLSTGMVRLLQLSPNLNTLVSEQDNSQSNNNFQIGSLSASALHVSSNLEPQTIRNNNIFASQNPNTAQLETAHIKRFSEALYAHGKLQQLNLRHGQPQSPSFLVEKLLANPASPLVELQFSSYYISIICKAESGCSVHAGCEGENGCLAPIVEGLTACPEINTLCLRHGILFETQASELFQEFTSARNGQLRVLELKSCRLQSDSIPLFVKGIRNLSSSLERLEISDAGGDSDTIVNRIVCDGLLSTGNLASSLCHLSFAASWRGALSVRSLCCVTKILINLPKLESLDLCGQSTLFEEAMVSRMEDQHEDRVAAFCTALKSNTGLRKLRVSASNNEAHGTKLICGLFQALEEESNNTLQELDMSNSQSFPSRGEWIKSLGRIKGLKRIVFPRMFLDCVDFYRFQVGLNQNTSLVSCEFQGNFRAAPMRRIIRRNQLLAHVVDHNKKNKNGDEDDDKPEEDEMTDTPTSSKADVPAAALPVLLHVLGSNHNEGSPIFSLLRSNPGCFVVC